MRVLSLLMIATSVPADAAPTYLTCTLADDAKPNAFAVAIDEQNQAATITITATGFSQKRPAVFTARSVAFQSKIGGVATIDYLIDRTTLAFTRALSAGATPTSIRSGVCKVEEIPKRAF